MEAFAGGGWRETRKGKITSTKRHDEGGGGGGGGGGAEMRELRDGSRMDR